MLDFEDLTPGPHELSLDFLERCVAHVLPRPIRLLRRWLRCLWRPRGGRFRRLRRGRLSFSCLGLGSFELGLFFGLRHTLLSLLELFLVSGSLLFYLLLHAIQFIFCQLQFLFHNVQLTRSNSLVICSDLDGHHTLLKELQERASANLLEVKCVLQILCLRCWRHVLHAPICIKPREANEEAAPVFAFCIFIGETAEGQTANNLLVFQDPRARCCANAHH
mmetsp:Transcript_59995/g.131456  ORF Transcript_59995/g.131456 Transcript_59995/m.131456 type:complete len:220 (+) Transcript_59995:394-1053(+)